MDSPTLETRVTAWIQRHLRDEMTTTEEAQAWVLLAECLQELKRLRETRSFDADALIEAMDLIDTLRPEHGGNGGAESCPLCRAIDSFDAALKRACDFQDEAHADSLPEPQL